MSKVCDVLRLDKKQMLLNVSLNRNTIADRVSEVSTNSLTQLSERSRDFIAYSLAVDKSTEMTDTAQLAIFIRGVVSNLCVAEVILDIELMHGTMTEKDIFKNVCQSVTDTKLLWNKLVGLTTEGAPAMCGETSGLVGRMPVEKQEENCAGVLTEYHCIIHQETMCRKVLKIEHVITTETQTLNFVRARGLYHRQFQFFTREINLVCRYSLSYRGVLARSGKVLNRVFEINEKMCQFMDSKSKDYTSLRDGKWKCELAYLVDVTAYLNVLNLQLKGRDRMITDMYDAVKAI